MRISATSARYLFIFAMLSLGFSFLACGPGEPTCTSSSECQDGKICKDSKCVACTGDTDCISGTTCQSGICKEAKACTDKDCKAGQYCDGKTCVDGCTKDDHCDRDKQCDTKAKKCVDCVDDKGCDRDKQCDTKTNKCVTSDTCRKDDDCKDDKKCSKDGKCVACTEDSHCQSGEICKDNKCEAGCRKDRGEFGCPAKKVCKAEKCVDGCLDDKDCDKGTCNSSTKTCAECSKSSDCKDGKVCRDKKCDACKDDKECDGSYCVSGACVECRKLEDCKDGKFCDKGSCKVCQSSADCGTGQICKNQKCIIGCDKDSDCSNGQPCLKNKCGCKTKQDCPKTNYCSAQSTCEACPDDAKCAAGELCLSGVCAPNACRKDADCTDSAKPKCDTGNNKCVECLQRSDCTGGKICTNKACSSCQKDTDCDKKEECKAGSCQGKVCGSNEELDSNGNCVCKTGYKKENGKCLLICRSDQVRDTNTGGCKCGTGKEEFKKQCVAKCRNDQVRNQASGKCECNSGFEEWQKQCKPICRSDQVRDSKGDCTCATGKEEYNNKCVDACKGGQKRNLTTGICECPPSKELFNNNCVDKCRSDQTRNQSSGVCGCKSTEEECQNTCKTKCASHLKRDNSCNCVCPPGYKDTGSKCEIVCRADMISDGKGGCICKPGFIDDGKKCVAGSCSALSCQTNQDCSLSGPNKGCLKRCAGAFVWKENKLTGKGSCVSNENFCKGKTAPTGAFGSTYLVVKSDKTTSPNDEQPVCVTNSGYFYKPADDTYGECDVDKDGWINIRAYQTYVELQKGTNTPKHYWDNYRCKVNVAIKVSYVRDFGERKPQVFEIGKLKQSFFLVETKRNDGQPDSNNPMPTYPKAPSGNETFKPETVNTLTKACLNSNMDLNDNNILDHEETVLSKPSTSREAVLGAHLKWSYYMELHYGYFEPGATQGSNNKQVGGTYHIIERPREGTSIHLLGLKCGQEKSANNHWQRCLLKDDQACKDKQGKTIENYSDCRPNDIRYMHALPSLFRCIQFQSKITTPPPGSAYDPKLQRSNTFLTGNRGIVNHSDRNKDTYSRTSCTLDATALSMAKGQQKDVKFTCSEVKTNAAPLSVGWVCQTYKNYGTPSAYKGGCVQECTENQYNGDPNYLYTKAKPFENLNPCPGNQVLGEKLCRTQPDNFGKGNCDLFLHYGTLQSTGCVQAPTGQQTSACFPAAIAVGAKPEQCSANTSCVTDKDCPQGVKCQSNKCVASSTFCLFGSRFTVQRHDCSTDTDCPTGAKCKKDASNQFNCMKSCSKDSDCPNNSKCKNSECVVPPNFFLIGGITPEGSCDGALRCPCLAGGKCNAGSGLTCKKGFCVK